LKYIVYTSETGYIDPKNVSITDLPIQFCYNEFSTIDPRLKSYVRHTFFRENEEFVLVFRVSCAIFNYYFF